MRCYICNEDDGNFPIWVQPNGMDPPMCYCPRTNEFDGSLDTEPPCVDQGCYPDWTRYACQHCSSHGFDDFLQRVIEETFFE